jgi:3',5'-cyclic AMP phosphodiesterase CpdA
VGQALTILLAAGVVAAVAQYRRQIVSYATHLKGSPTHTEPYVPFPADDLPELRIGVAGDVGDSGSRIGATGAAMTRLADDRPFDVLLLLGDNVYPRGNPKDIPARVFKPFAGVLDRGTELLVIVGNHDKRHSHAQLQAFGMPGHWWSAVRGDVLIVGLDSNLGADPEQLAFLDKTLAESTQRWKIVALHHPPYSAGYQGSSIGIRDAYVPIFERHGVQLVLSGHEHDYQRSRVINGITYVITGAASGTRRTGEADFTAASFWGHSCVEVGVYPDRLVGRALNQKDRVADEWVVTP